MTRYRLLRVAYVALCASVGLFSPVTAVFAQFDAGSLAQADALSAAAKATPQLAKELAKELGSTPEQAAGAAGVIFGIAKSFLSQEDFAKMAEAVPGMDALLAAAPTDAVGTSGQPAALAPSTLTPGFASSGPSMSAPSTAGLAMAVAPSGVVSAIAGLSKLGIKPEMMAKAVPFLSGYLKKHAGAAVGGLLGGVFNQGK